MSRNVECCSQSSLVFVGTLTKLNGICCGDILFLLNNINYSLYLGQSTQHNEILI